MTSDHPAESLPSQPSGSLAGGTVRRIRRWPLVLLVAVIGLAAVGGVVGIYAYRKATEPDRSTPAISADAFLQAVFVEGSAVRVGLYTCAAWPAGDALAQTRALGDPEAKISWDTLVSSQQTDGHATVAARVRFQYHGEIAPSDEEQWTLSLTDENGWRVCSAAPTLGR